MEDTMELARFDANTTRLDILQNAVDELGYVILENALDEIRLKNLHQELEPYFEGRANSKAHFFGFNTKRIEALFTKSEIAQEMATHPAILSLVDHVLGENCDTFQINLTQGIRINPGEEAQILHPDSAMFPISNKPFEFQLNAIWAYSEFTEKNGATVIVPGSHRWQEGRMPQPHEITQAVMKPGCVLIYAASLLHGGGANYSALPRTGIAISYCLGWLRQSENQYLAYPPEVARHFNPQLQHLIGYHVHKPNLGWVHGHDPKDLLTGEDHTHLGAQDFLTDEQKILIQSFKKDASVAITSHSA
jgi:ectoine hydroxylase-related dioxygenase (phytanoyl-CoA dioxygenase family)